MVHVSTTQPHLTGTRKCLFLLKPQGNLKRESTEYSKNAESTKSIHLWHLAIQINLSLLAHGYSLIFSFYSLGWQTNDYCLVIFDQISYYCFHSTSSKSLRKNSKYQQVRNSGNMITGKAWCMFLHISFLESHVTGGYQNGD